MQFVPEEALRAQKAAARNPVELTFADLALVVAQGDPIDMADTFKKFFVRPRSVRDYAKTILSGASGR